MSAVALLAAAAIGGGAAAIAALIVPPTTRLAPRVRPYAAVARSALGVPGSADAARPVAHPGGALTRLFWPPLLAAVARIGRSAEGRGDEQLMLLLRRAGEADRTPDEYRVRQLGEALVVGFVSGTAVALLLRTPVAALLASVAGFVVGLTRSRRRLERNVADRAGRIRLELYTVNHLLAMHVRTGAGPMQAVQRLVDRGHGAAVSELRDALAWIRSGMGEAAAFRRAAELSPEPSATRTYQLLAAASSEAWISLEDSSR